MKADSKHIIRIHTLLSELGLRDDKAYKKELVQQYTNNRESSTKEMTIEEAQHLIADLQKLAKNNPDDIKANQKRRQILRYAHEMRWEHEDGSVDMGRVNGWCIAKGKYHKELNKHTLNELSGLIWQFEQVYKSFLSTL